MEQQRWHSYQIPLPADYSVSDVANYHGSPPEVLSFRREVAPSLEAFRRSLSGTLANADTRARKTPRRAVLLTTPIWPGFAVNTLLYAGILYLPFAPFALRRFIRHRRGLCPGCGYPIGESDVCTECGAELRGRLPAAAP